MRGGFDMQPHPFQRAKGAVIIGPGHRGAGHQAHIGQRAQFGQHGLGPVGAGLAVDAQVFGQQAAAHAGIFFGEDHIRPRLRSGQRSHQARGTRSDDQHIAEGPGLFILRLVMFARQRAKACGAADQRFIELFPQGARPHEGLVIEPGRQEGRGQIIDRQKVEFQRWEAVLAAGGKAVEQFLHRGADIRGLLVALKDFHHGVGLFTARRQHAARAVVFEAAPHQTHIIGQ